MTFDEIEQSLPNGFHDAELFGLEIDFVSRTARFDLSLWMARTISAGEAYRRAELILRGLEFCTIDPPKTEQWGADQGSLMIDAGPGQPRTAPIDHPVLRYGTFMFWVFVSDWNSFIRVAAQDAVLTWKE